MVNKYDDWNAPGDGFKSLVLNMQGYVGCKTTERVQVCLTETRLPSARGGEIDTPSLAAKLFWRRLKKGG